MKKVSKKVYVRGDCSSRWQPVFSKLHFVMTAVAIALIVTGFVMMLPEVDVRNQPGGRFAPAPGPGAFEAKRIKLAPIPCFVGFALMPFIIMYVPGDTERDDEMGKNGRHTKKCKSEGMDKN